MRSLIVAILGVVILGVVMTGAVMADTYQQTGPLTVTELFVSSGPLAPVQAWAQTTVAVDPPHGIDGCALRLAIENDEHSLIGRLADSLNDGTAVRLVVEDTLPEIRQTCWIRGIDIK